MLVFNECAKIIASTKQTIDNLSSQTQSIFPILLTLITSSGASASSTLYQPVCIFITNVITALVNKLLFPILIGLTLLSILSSLSEKFTLKGVKEFLTQAFKWIIGLTVSIFSIFISVKGITASNYDQISLRVLKYAVGSGLPLIGGIAKEGVDLVLTASILLKNAVGSIAIFGVAISIFQPVIKIMLFSLLLKLLSGICEPIADFRISLLFSNLSKVISMLVTLLVMIFIIYFLTIILMVGTNGAIG